MRLGLLLVVKGRAGYLAAVLEEQGAGWQADQAAGANSKTSSLITIVLPCALTVCRRWNRTPGGSVHIKAKTCSSRAIAMSEAHRPTIWSSVKSVPGRRNAISKISVLPGHSCRSQAMVKTGRCAKSKQKTVINGTAAHISLQSDARLAHKSENRRHVIVRRST